MGHGKASPWFRLALNFVFQLGGTRFKVINLHIVEDADTKDPFAKTKQSGLSFGDFAGAWSPETEVHFQILKPLRFSMTNYSILFLRRKL